MLLNKISGYYRIGFFVVVSRESSKMHVPDGIVPLWLQILLLITSVTVLGMSIRIINRRYDDRLVPYMGVLAAVIFAAQFVNFPVPPFSSGHLVGSTLLAVMVGPWVAVVIMALVLFVQALYGDGGIVAYGLNLFNMGVFSVLLGYGLALALFKSSRKITSKKNATLFSAGVASFFVTVSAAFLLGVELLTVPGFGIEALTAITGVHVIIGLGEAILTSVILLYFIKANPKLISFLKNDDLGEKELISIDEASEEQERDTGPRIREIVPTVLLTIVIIAFTIFTGVASESPDGFEWALFEFAGVADPEIGFEGVWSFLGEGIAVDVLTGSIGILIALGLSILIFKKTSPDSKTKSKHKDKFLLPFADGRRQPSAFSSTAMLVSAFVLAVLISLQVSLTIVLLTIGLVLFVGGVSGTSWRRVIPLAAKFEVIILFWIIFEPFLFGSTVIFTLQLPWGPLNAYSEGLYLGLLLGSRMFAILLLFLSTLSHMTLNEFIGALRTLRVPASVLGSLLIMFRYVPLFMEEKSRMQDAQLLRGFDRGHRLERIRSLGYLVGTTINRAFYRSQTVYEAMSLRGFGKGMMITGAGIKRNDAMLPILVFMAIVSITFLFPILLEVLVI